MPVGLLAAGAMGVGSIISSFLSSQAVKSSSKMTIAARKEASLQAWQREVAMWKMRNRYNLPKNQMRRLKQAGLNPNLVYGSGSVAGNAAGAIPSYDTPQLSVKRKAVDFGAAFQSAIRTKLHMQQLDNMQAQKANVMAETLTELSRNSKVANEADLAQVKLYVQKALKEASVQEGWLDLKMKGAGLDIKQQTLNNMKAEFKLKMQKLSVEKQREVLMKFQSELAKVRAQLAKQGIMPRDSTIYRLLRRAYNSVIGGFMENTMPQGLKQQLQY